MHAVTKNVGNSIPEPIIVESTAIKRILISRPNHRLGNLVLITPLVQEAINTFPDSQVDLFVKGNLAAAIFSNYGQVGKIIPLPEKPFSSLYKYFTGWMAIRSRKYDLVINANAGSSSGKLSVFLAKSPNKFYGEFNDAYDSKYADYDHEAKNQVYNLRENLLWPRASTGKDRVPCPDLRLKPDEIAAGKRCLKAITKNTRRTISLFTNATGQKCYPESWWCEFYQKLTARFPNYNIIEVLPKDKISRLAFQASTFHTHDIRQMGALIANTALFISADCGVMHLASAVGTPTVGLFSVTNEKQYAPYSPGSFAINTNLVSDREAFELIGQCLLNGR